MNLFSVYKFKYDDKERFVFITEQSVNLVSGYEINGIPEIAGKLSELFSLLKDGDNKEFLEEKKKMNLPPFRRYTVSKIKEEKRLI